MTLYFASQSHSLTSCDFSTHIFVFLPYESHRKGKTSSVSLFADCGTGRSLPRCLRPGLCIQYRAPTECAGLSPRETRSTINGEKQPLLGNGGGDVIVTDCCVSLALSFVPSPLEERGLNCLGRAHQSSQFGYLFVSAGFFWFVF